MRDRLNPSDIPVALCLALHPGQPYELVASAMGIAPSSAHRSVRRLQKAGLLRSEKRIVNRLALSEFLRHGIRYAFAASAGPVRRGVPTAYSAPPLNAEIVSDRPVVWASPEGAVEGISVVPLYDQAPDLVERNPELYEALALVDAIRIGRARERQRAADLLDALLLRQDRRQVA